MVAAQPTGTGDAALAAYIPEDRRRALANGATLPSCAEGSVLFADISGFTPLTEAMAQRLGPKRGAEVLTRLLNEVYTGLIAAVQRCGGSVIGFSGDAITCWFGSDLPEPPAFRAVAAAFGVQAAMEAFADLEVESGVRAALAVKCAVATGAVFRCVVGEPTIQRFDVVAGETVQRMALGEQAAGRGEVLLDAATWACLGEPAVRAWRTQGSEHFALLTDPPQSVRGEAAAPQGEPPDACEWVLPALVEAIRGGQERFLAELRPAAALFVRFGGIDFEADPDAPARLDAYVHWAQGVVRRLEGVLIQLTTGDKGSYLYAAFGAPIAHDDDCARAAAAALELLAPPDHLAFVATTQIGLSQGLMRVGAYGSATRRTYGVLGDAVNVAARLMVKAEPGQALATGAFVAAAGADLRVQSIGAIALKGKGAPTPLYTLLGVECTTAQESYRSLYTGALVGRTAEVEAGRALLHATAQGRGGVVDVEGPAGIGKSHLVASLVAEAESAGLAVLVATCQSTTQGSAYAALRPLLLGLLGLHAERSPAETAAALAARAEPQWRERLPLLREPLGLPLDDTPLTAHLKPRLRQSALITLVLEIAAWAARRRPLLLVAEDAHWMDEASQPVVLALARAAAAADARSADTTATGLHSVGLLCVHRPTAERPTPLLEALADLEPRTQLLLAELSPSGTAALAHARLGAPVEPLAAALLHARAQGNPFFTEELIDALVDAGQFVRTAQGWTLAPDTIATLRAAHCLEGDEDTPALRPAAPLADVDLGVPGSVQGVVLARLDRLPDAARLTLKVASVFGQTFALPLLRRVRPLAALADAIPSSVEQALARDFVRVEQPQTELYLFKHNITREVAYGTLLEEQRRELHEAVGDVIEAEEPGAIDALAHHFARSDTRRPALRAKAVHYLERAGQAALHGYANDTALAYYAEAYALEPAARFLSGQIAALHTLGRRDEQQRALELLARAPDAEPIQRALLWGEYAEATGAFDDAETALHQALAAAQVAGDRPAQAKALNHLGLVAWRRGDYPPAEQHFRRALEVVEDESSEAADAWYGLGLVFRQTGRYADARVAFLRDLAISQRLGRREREARTLSALGHVESIERDHAAALEFYRRALAIRKAIGDRSGVGSSLLSLAQAHGSLGDHAGALPLLHEARRIQQAIRNRWAECLIWNELGILHWMVGEYGAATETLTRGLALAQAIESEIGTAYILCNLGQVQRDAGELDEAVATLQQGLALARAQDDTGLEAICLGDLALAEQLQGSHSAARAHAQQADALFRALEQEASRCAVLATLAAASLALDDRDAAAAHVADALALLDGPDGDSADFPHRERWSCAAVLDGLGRPDEAAVQRQAARAILLARAERISSDEMRSGYLSNVPLHRLIRGA